LRQIAGAKTIEVELAPDATVRTLFQNLSADYPALAEFVLASDDALKPGIQLLVNGRHIDFLDGVDTALDDAQTIFLIPPVIGG
jgi:MoaD family protein